ncbi:hypothetical protein N7478_001172 [Penicillium angulare]|uniref:uncharacterized protein n=1 Tax=Penicillium angulare TaxID=116970 RepID=UPI0025421959|nr:uncharacterized protein N7478_001172 [Penicillium angulare]KAJ5291921.1 hypothetical protein N7478_001172 [Penicillium angulare]
MEPFTAVGLAGNIVEFISFSYQIISGVKKLLDNPNGTSPENQRLSDFLEDLNAVTQGLMTDLHAKTENEKQLCALAANCHELSTELYQILRSLRVGDNKSKWEAIMVMWSSMRREKEIETIERRLHGYQSQILIRLQIMFSQETDHQNSLINSRLEASLKEGKLLQNRTSSHLEELLQTILGLVTSLESNAPAGKLDGPEQALLAQLGSSISEFQGMTNSLSRENKILQQLAFPSMYNREGSIESPESGTFAWMIDETYQPRDDDGEESDVEWDESDEIYKKREQRRLYRNEKKKQEVLRRSTRESFLTWVETGRHIFHISGKAGSGKSTLMKFLSRSSRVKKGLEAWADGQPLVLVQFFFWNSGDQTQMSLEGLYRSLLFEACRQIPSLIPLLFPEIWGSPNLGVVPFHFDTIRTAFDCFIKEASASSTHFCFFIDGLDEFQGDEVDYWRLSRDLQSWTAGAKNVKLCVSSRPHIPFVQSFANPLNSQVSIHDLTREDIFNFSATMFEKDPNFHRIKDTYEDLVIEVVDSSDGVFLWARLVVRSLLRSIGYQDNEKNLKRQLSSMPRGLAELFDQILGSIDSNDQCFSDRLFLLTTPDFCPWQPIVRNAISYSWLEDLEDAEFPYKCAIQACTEAEIDEKLERVSCALDRFSQGLLLISRRGTRESDGHDYFTHEVQFLHRSVREYIVNTREAQMRQRMPDFDVPSAIIRLLLAEMKFALPTKHDAKPRTWTAGGEGGPLRRNLHIFFTIISAAHEKCGHVPRPRFFEEASSIVQHHGKFAGFQPENEPESGVPEPKGHLFGQNLQRIGDEWSIRRASNHPPDFLCEALNRNMQRFLSPDLMAALKKQNSISGPNLLLAGTRHSNDLDFIRELLREGRSPLEKIRMEPIRPFDPVDRENYKTITAPKPEVSLWLLFLYGIVEDYILAGSADKDENETLEEFLKCDVDCDVFFIVRKLDLSKRKKKVAENDKEPEDSNDSVNPDQLVAFDLMEFLEFMKPFNLEALLEQLSRKPARRDRSEVKHHSGFSVPYKRGSLAKTIDNIVAASEKHRHFGFGVTLCVESVINPYERLDVPFAFRMT